MLSSNPETVNLSKDSYYYRTKRGIYVIRACRKSGVVQHLSKIFISYAMLKKVLKES